MKRIALISYQIFAAFTLLAFTAASYREAIPFWFWESDAWSWEMSHWIGDSIILSFYFLCYSAFVYCPYYLLCNYFEKKELYLHYQDFGYEHYTLAEDNSSRRLSFIFATWIGLTFMFFHGAIFAFIANLPTQELYSNAELGASGGIERLAAIGTWCAWIWFTFKASATVNEAQNYLENLTRERCDWAEKHNSKR